MTTVFLAELIEVKDFRTSKSFSGNPALLFSNRVNLLIDVDALTTDQRAPLQNFIEIRNKFIHDLEADTMKIVSAKSMDVKIGF